MRTDLQVVEAVKLVYEGNLRTMSKPINDWQMFTPFVNHQDGNILLFKLIELPNNFRTSDEIQVKTQQNFQGILQNVHIVTAEREQETCYYLVQGFQNVIPLDLFIKVKRQTRQKIDQSLILKFLEFASKLENHPFSNKIGFNLNGISLTENQSFILTNYSMYFVKESKTSRGSQKWSNLSKDIKNVVARLLMLNQNQESDINLNQLYSHVQIAYGTSMLEIIKKVMIEDFKASEAVTMISESNSFIDTALTQSFTTGNVLSQEIKSKSSDNTHFYDVLEQPLIGYSKKDKKKSRVFGLAIVFVLILLGISTVTYRYLKPRLIQCRDNQYHDEQLNQCFGCNPLCDRCMGSEQNMCLSCTSNKFLVKMNKSDGMGTCAGTCRGMKIQHQRVCIVNGNDK